MPSGDVPLLEEGTYEAARFRITRIGRGPQVREGGLVIGNPPPTFRDHPLTRLTQLGLPVELSRAELLDSVSGRRLARRDDAQEERRALEWVFIQKDFDVEAWVLGKWVWASWWRIQESQRAAKAVPDGGASNIELAVARVREARARATGKRLGLGEIVCHLQDNEKLSPEECLKVLNGAGYEEVHGPKQLPRHLKNGRQREQRGASCRFCDSP